MSYAIFRASGVKNTATLKGLNKHDKERISHTNPDINTEKIKDNFHLIDCSGTYNNKFNKIVEPFRVEHMERMKTMRADRKTTFENHINNGKNNIACDMIFTSDEKFFNGMSRGDIQKWAESSLEFVIQDIGIPKENIIDAVVHLDEKTPHMHLICVPLTKIYDGRIKSERWSINQNKFIGNKKHLSELQDKYYNRMKSMGYNLERGEKGSNKRHKETVQYKKERLADIEKSLSELENVTSSIINTFKQIKPKKSLIGDKVTITQEEYKAIMLLAQNGAAAILKTEKLKKELKETKLSLDNKENKFSSLLELTKMYKDNFTKYKGLGEKLEKTEYVIKKLNLGEQVRKELVKLDNIEKNKINNMSR